MYSILTECPLFRGLTEDQIHEVIDGRGDYTLADYRDGELIARRDTAYSGLMIIVRGKVHGEMPAASGRPVTIEPLEAPQLIAPAFLFGGYNKLPIDVVADGDATIMTLHRGYLVRADAEQRADYVELHRHHLEPGQRLVEKNLFPVVPLAEGEGGRAICSGIRPKLPPRSRCPTSGEIAQYFDATRSAVQTVLAELEKKRLVALSGDRITVLNRKGLEDILK